uniref:Uncharacterized protein n=1 Tax=Arundo donax TaxID=35708 RepID=A0A0A9EMP3_ARUDO
MSPFEQSPSWKMDCFSAGILAKLQTWMERAQGSLRPPGSTYIDHTTEVSLSEQVKASIRIEEALRNSPKISSRKKLILFPFT